MERRQTRSNWDSKWQQKKKKKSKSNKNPKKNSKTEEEEEEEEDEPPKKKKKKSKKSKSKSKSKTRVGVYRSDGETHISGNHEFEAMDLGKNSVTTFKLQNLGAHLQDMNQWGRTDV